MQPSLDAVSAAGPSGGPNVVDVAAVSTRRTREEVRVSRISEKQYMYCFHKFFTDICVFIKWRELL